VIRSFRHRGLRRLFEDGDRKGIRPDLLDRIENILFLLSRAKEPAAIDVDLTDYHQENEPCR
jgi:toxin HigB-1